eukprot:scaffold259942_cov15-Tisochrysis_lutea.AAC.1
MKGELSSRPHFPLCISSFPSGRRFLAQQEVAVAHAQLSPRISAGSAPPASPAHNAHNELSPRNTPTKSSPTTATPNGTAVRHLPAGSAPAASPTHDGKTAHAAAAHAALSEQDGWGSPVQNKAPRMAPFAAPPAYLLFPGTPMSSSPGPQHSLP